MQRGVLIQPDMHIAKTGLDLNNIFSSLDWRSAVVIIFFTAGGKRVVPRVRMNRSLRII